MFLVWLFSDCMLLETLNSRNTNVRYTSFTVISLQMMNAYFSSCKNSELSKLHRSVIICFSETYRLLWLLLYLMLLASSSLTAQKFIDINTRTNNQLFQEIEGSFPFLRPELNLTFEMLQAKGMSNADIVWNYNLLLNAIKAKYDKGESIKKKLSKYQFSFLTDRAIPSKKIDEESLAFYVNRLMVYGYTPQIIEKFYREKNINPVTLALSDYEYNDTAKVFFSDGVIVGHIDSAYYDISPQDGRLLSFAVTIREVLKGAFSNNHLVLRASSSAYIDTLSGEKLILTLTIPRQNLLQENKTYLLFLDRYNYIDAILNKYSPSINETSENSPVKMVIATKSETEAVKVPIAITKSAQLLRQNCFIFTKKYEVVNASTNNKDTASSTEHTYFLESDSPEYIQKAIESIHKICKEYRKQFRAIR